LFWVSQHLKESREIKRKKPLGNSERWGGIEEKPRGKGKDDGAKKNDGEPEKCVGRRGKQNQNKKGNLAKKTNHSHLGSQIRGEEATMESPATPTCLPKARQSGKEGMACIKLKGF